MKEKTPVCTSNTVLDYPSTSPAWVSMIATTFTLAFGSRLADVLDEDHQDTDWLVCVSA